MLCPPSCSRLIASCLGMAISTFFPSVRPPQLCHLLWIHLQGCADSCTSSLFVFWYILSPSQMLPLRLLFHLLCSQKWPAPFSPFRSSSLRRLCSPELSDRTILVQSSFRQYCGFTFLYTACSRCLVQSLIPFVSTSLDPRGDSFNFPPQTVS